MVQRTYGAMTNDVLISIPLFVLMGYVMERGALVDRMFYSIQLAFRNVPASLAVATLIVCTFWGIASGLVGAVVVLLAVGLHDYQTERLQAWLNPWADPLGKGFHTIQGLLALGLGGITGAGLGESRLAGGLFLPNEIGRAHV